MLTASSLLWSVPVAAVVLDRICGEPPASCHPVCMMGAWAQRVEKAVYNQNAAFVRGMLAALLVVVPCGVIGWGLTEIAFAIHPALGLLAGVVCVYLCLAPRSLAEHALDVAEPLQYGDKASARQAVSMLVGRNTENLDSHGIARACIESVGENLTDGVTATLFWATIGGSMGGLSGAAAAVMVHRSANCLDAMWGKKNERYIHFGTVAARLDDMLNFLPARLTFPVIAIAAMYLKKIRRNDACFVHNAWQQGWNYRHAHASPNSAWSEAAFAGALNLKLGGPVWYKDLYAPHPYLGDGTLDATPAHIRNAVDLMWASTVLFAIFCGFVLVF